MRDTRLLRLDLAPSLRFALALIALHVAAAASIVAVLPTLPGAALAALVLALGLAAARDRALLRGRRSLRAIEISPAGTAHATFADGGSAPLEALRGMGVTPLWVALRVRSPLRRGALVSADMLAPGRFRLLRLWALWGRLPGAVPGPSSP